MLKLLVQPKNIPWMDFWTSSQRLLQDFFEKSKSNNHITWEARSIGFYLSTQKARHTDTKERFDLVGKCFYQVKVVAFYNNSRLTLFKGLIY